MLDDDPRNPNNLVNLRKLFGAGIRLDDRKRKPADRDIVLWFIGQEWPDLKEPGI